MSGPRPHIRLEAMDDVYGNTPYLPARSLQSHLTQQTHYQQPVSHYIQSPDPVNQMASLWARDHFYEKISPRGTRLLTPSPVIPARMLPHPEPHHQPADRARVYLPHYGSSEMSIARMMAGGLHSHLPQDQMASTVSPVNMTTMNPVTPFANHRVPTVSQRTPTAVIEQDLEWAAHQPNAAQPLSRVFMRNPITRATAIRPVPGMGEIHP